MKSKKNTNISILIFPFELLITLIIYMFSKSVFLYSAWILILLIKIAVRYVQSKNNKYIFLNNNKISIKKDLNIRWKIYCDVQIIIFSILLYVLKSIKSNDYSVYIEFFLLVYGIFISLSFFAYKSKAIIFNIIPIISSTPISLALIFELMNIIAKGIIKSVQSIYVFSFATAPPDNLRGAILQLFSHMKDDIYFTIYSTIVFIILYFLYISMAPTYCLDSLKSSFNLISTIISCLGIVILVVSVLYSPKIQNIALNNNELITSDEQAFNYYTNFSSSDLKDILSQSILPYSIGIILCNGFINLRIRRASSKKEKILERILNCNDKTTIEYEKIEFLKLGGKSIELKLIDKIKGIE